MRRPRLGERRIDVRVQAVVDLPAATAVVWREGAWIALPANSPQVTGVTLRAVRAGGGVWARVYGATKVRCG